MGWWLGFVVAGCAPDPGPAPCDVGLPTTSGLGRAQNVVVVLLDDLGVERFAQYADATHPLPLPAFDRLGAEGIRFDSAYVDPTCSPTRASILTGRRPRRHSVGRFLKGRDGEQAGLPHAERTIPEMLREAPTGPWSTAALGKWHLDAFNAPDPAGAPLAQGFDTFVGLIGNPQTSLTLPGGQTDYFWWESVTDGEISERRGYLTTATTDDAILQLQTLPEPYFVYVAYNAAHSPFHTPPAQLLDVPLRADASDVELQDAMTVALDREFGRLLDEVDLEDTLLLVLSDNGTPAESDPTEGGGQKGTLRELGVRVPMWAAGVGVEEVGSSTDAFVYAADLFATVADVAGVDLDGRDAVIDGRSLLPLLEDPGQAWRPCLVTERFPDNGHPHRGDDLSIRDDERLVIDGSSEAKEFRRRDLDRVGAPSEVRRSGWSPSDEAGFDQLRRWLREDRHAVR